MLFVINLLISKFVIFLSGAEQRSSAITNWPGKLKTLNNSNNHTIDPDVLQRVWKEFSQSIDADCAERWLYCARVTCEIKLDCK